MPNRHPFDRATDLTEQETGRWLGETIPEYGNIIGAFGGVVAATLLNSVLKDSRTIGHPVSQTVNFCKALGQGPFEINTSLKHGGKYTQHWSAELIQEGKTMATASIVCAVRTEVFSHQPAQMPAAPPPLAANPSPPVTFVNWAKRYDFQYVEGELTMLNRDEGALGPSRSVLWLRDNPPRPLDYLALASFADCFFLRLLHIRGKMEPMGTVTLTTHFLATADELARQGKNPVLGVADSYRAHGNFHDQQVQLWSTEGTVLATGTQIVWYRQ